MGNLVIRKIDLNRDLIQVINIVTRYYSKFTYYLPKTETDMRIVFKVPDFCEEASFVAQYNGEIVGFVGALLRKEEDLLEGEIVGLSTMLDPNNELYFNILGGLLDKSIEALNKRGATKISTIASPQFSVHYRFLFDYGFRPVKAWYLMKVRREELVFPKDLAEDLEILSFKEIEVDKRSKIDLVVSVLNAAFFGDLGGGWDESEFFLRFREPVFDPSGVFVGYSEGQPVGVVWVFTDEYKLDKEIKKVGWIALLGLKREFRGKKYGRTLLERSVKYLLDNGVKEILLWVDSENSTALRLYRMFNFSVERASYLMWYFPKR
ncbi:MAG: GNAT family N-acetyltransferase [Candidatus Njordarchaeia archaeon]